MGNSNLLVQPSFNIPGPCIMQVWDDTLDGWRHDTKVTGVNVRSERTQIVQTHQIKGVREVVRKKCTGSTGTVSFTMAESMSPAMLKMVLGDKSVDQTLTADTVSPDMPFITTLYGTDEQEVQNPYAIANYAHLTAPTFTAVATGTGGALSAGTYYVWVQAYYNASVDGVTSAPTVASLSTGLDYYYCLGAPSDESSTVAGYGGKAVTVSGSGKTMVITIADPTGTNAPTPTGYLVWVDTTDSISAAVLNSVASRSGASTVVTLTAGPYVTATTTHVGYTAGIGASFYSIAGYSSGTPTYTKLTSSDITFNSETGMFKRVSGGSLTDGSDVRVICWNIVDPHLDTDTGTRTVSSDYRKLRFLSLEEQPSADQTPGRAEGKEIICYRVDCSNPTTSQSFTEEDFEEGMPVELTMLYDPTQGKAYTTRIWSGHLHNWVQNYI